MPDPASPPLPLPPILTPLLPAPDGAATPEGTGQVGAAPDATVLLHPMTVLGAVSDGARYLLLKEMAGGEPVSVNDLAARLKRSPDLISKHLRVLREARLIMAVAPPDGDGRKQFHQVPAPFRTKDASGAIFLDFGSVLLRF
jgi:DNA-binding transcriptional ArsR family regulator